MEIVSYRKKFTEDLLHYAKNIHKEISGEEFEVVYKTGVSAKEEFESKLEKSLEREIELGFTLYGPHRDDLEISVGGKDMKTYGSQGQHRSAVLALKLAQADLIFAETGEYPVLLLDDIMSELDGGRRAYLSGKIRDKQVIITCTDADGLPDSRDANLICVHEGKFRKRGIEHVSAPWWRHGSCPERCDCNI